MTSPAPLTWPGSGTRYRQGELVLNGVDLEMERGRVPGIIGTNGSGKSTLLRILPGFSRESAGTVTVRPKGGYLPDRFPAAQRMSARAYLRHKARMPTWRACPKWTRC